MLLGYKVLLGAIVIYFLQAVDFFSYKYFYRPLLLKEELGARSGPLLK